MGRFAFAARWDNTFLLIAFYVCLLCFSLTFCSGEEDDDDDSGGQEEENTEDDYDHYWNMDSGRPICEDMGCHFYGLDCGPCGDIASSAGQVLDEAGYEDHKVYISCESVDGLTLACADDYGCFSAEDLCKYVD